MHEPQIMAFLLLLPGGSIIAAPTTGSRFRSLPVIGILDPFTTPLPAITTRLICELVNIPRNP